MKRRTFLAAIGAVLPAAGAQAQRGSEDRRFRVGYLSAGDTAWLPSLIEALKALGYVEGKNLDVQQRCSLGVLETLDELAAELVALKPTVLIGVSTPATRALLASSKTIPIVMVAVSNPVGAGFVDSVAHPGRNVTGIADNVGEIVLKRLELLREAIPGAKRVGVVWHARPSFYPGIDTGIDRLTKLALNNGIEIVSLPTSVPDDLDVVFDRISPDRKLDAALLLGGAMIVTHRRRVASAAFRNGLPAMATFVEEAADGGLIAYGPARADMNRSVATYVDRILRGGTPGDMPVEYPRKYALVVNLKTASALGITIPASILGRADEVIE